MEQPKFKVGEWCFCEFKLQQVKETKSDNITSVSDGIIVMSGSDLSDRCYPVEMGIKRISDSVSFWSKIFHELNCPSLNHPDLNRELIKRWVEMCEAVNDQPKLEKLYTGLEKFGKLIQERVREIGYEEVEGVKLFRR